MEQIEKPLAILLIGAALIFATMNFTNAGISAPEAALNNGVSMESAATNESVNVEHIAVGLQNYEPKTEALDTVVGISDTLWWFNEETQEAYYEIVQEVVISSEEE